MFKGKYDTLTSHKTMIQDEFRTFSYLNAINLAVEKNDIVLDFGSGSGLLAIAAARAGAKKVYSIERNPKTAKWLIENIKQNDLENIIEVFIGDAKDFIRNNKDISVNVIISECIGDHLFENKMIWEYLVLADYYSIQKKIPSDFCLSSYPICIKEKDFHFKKTLSDLETKNIKLDFSTSILKDEPLDICYFSNFQDTDDPYFCLDRSFNISDKDILLSFHDLESLKAFTNNKGVVQKEITLPKGDGYMMLYFHVKLYESVFFHNHPSRPYNTNHSYYQRLIKKEGKRGTLKIDLHYDKLYNEDSPCKNIWIEYD